MSWSTEVGKKLGRVKRRVPHSGGHKGKHRRFHFGNTSRLLAAVACGFVAGLLVLTLGPRLLNIWREDRWLKQAEQNLQRDNFSDATNAAKRALQIHPESLPAFRILAEATEKQNRAETVMWRAQIARLQPREVESQLNLASAALRFGQLDIARNALEQVPKENRDSAPYNIVAGWLARAQGDEAGQENHFAAALEKEPQNETYQYNLAAVRIQSSDPQKRDLARETLQRLAMSAPFRAGSLRALLRDAVQRRDPTAADRYAQELQMNPQVTFSDYLLCLDFYKKLDEKKFAVLLEKVKPVAARQPENLALLLGWLNDHALASEVLRWTEKLPPEKTTTPSVAVQIAEAYSTQKNWSRLRRWTRVDSWGEVEYLRLAYQALAARQTKQAAADLEFGSLWRSAERACEDDPERRIKLARLATKWNLPSEAEQLWLRVAQNPLTRREALDALFEIYRNDNDLPNLHLTAMRLHETSPNEPLLAAQYARLSIILNRNIREGQRVAQEAFDAAPEEPACVIAQALSLASLGHAADGIELCKKLPPEKLQDPHDAASFAALLLEDNQPEAAREFIEVANKGKIFVEERQLLDRAIQKNQAQRAASPAPNPSASPASSPTPSPTPSGSPA